jgi:ABC-type nitrate/sulfonate/bicarbonate transport system permease component
MKPLSPIPNSARVILGILFFVLFVAGWAWATLGGYVSKTFLADPLTMIEDGRLLLTKHGFLGDIGITIWRVLGGFVLAALVAVPIGILMGAYKPIGRSSSRSCRSRATCRPRRSSRCSSCGPASARCRSCSSSSSARYSRSS